MVKEIVTQRLVLRQLRPDDAQSMLAYRSDPRVARYQSWEPQSLDDVRSFIGGLAATTPFAPGTWCQLGLVLRSAGTLIGDCGVHVLAADPTQAELGITLAAPFQRQGYAAEALRAVLGLLFDTLGKRRAFASLDPRNTASVALIEGLGFRKEAHLVASLWFKGGWADDAVYATLAGEWRDAAGTTTPTS